MLVLPLVLLFSGCQKEDIPSITREDRFTIDIGRMEDQLDLFSQNGSQNSPALEMTMRDGFFYISNSNGDKVARYTSFGDLLFMIYNEETNPPPMTLYTNRKEGDLVTRWAYSYPLRDPGCIAVDSQKHIYVEDRLPPGRHNYDSENSALLDSMVLHFDQDGRFVEYLGQEGIGGTPFPRIMGLETSRNGDEGEDELAVICQTPSGWFVYWFDSNRTRVFLVKLLNQALPIPRDRSGVYPSVDKVLAARDGRKLFIKIDYYRDTFDESTNTRSGIEPDSSVLWVMNVEDGSYVTEKELPFFEMSETVNNRRSTEKLLYSLIGVSRGDRVFLAFPVERGYSIMILLADQQDREVERRGLIQVDREELRFNNFDVSLDGILSGVLATEWEIRVAWWRTDSLAAELSP